MFMSYDSTVPGKENPTTPGGMPGKPPPDLLVADRTEALRNRVPLIVCSFIVTRFFAGRNTKTHKIEFLLEETS
jgi:hypothetical protein